MRARARKVGRLERNLPTPASDVSETEFFGFLKNIGKENNFMIHISGRNNVNMKLLYEQE